MPKQFLIFLRVVAISILLPFGSMGQNAISNVDLSRTDTSRQHELDVLAQLFADSMYREVIGMASGIEADLLPDKKAVAWEVEFDRMTIAVG